MHIQTLRGRILETILSLRFFIFQYGIVYKLHLTGNDTSLAVHFFSSYVSNMYSLRVGEREISCALHEALLSYIMLLLVYLTFW